MDGVTPQTPALRITSKREGFRRAGMAHPARPVLHEAGRFSPAQIQALLAERMLTVEVIEPVSVIDDMSAAILERAAARDIVEGGLGGEDQPGAAAVAETLTGPAEASDALAAAASAHAPAPQQKPAEGVAAAPAVPRRKQKPD